MVAQDGDAHDPDTESVPLRLLRLSTALQQQAVRRTVDIAAGAQDPSFRLVGHGGADITRGLLELEPRARSSVLNLQRRIPFDPRGLYEEADRSSRDRGVTLALVVPPAALEANRLLTTYHPPVRVAPVYSPLLIIDDEAVVVAGAPTPLGEQTAWLTDDPDLMARARELWQQTYDASCAALPDGDPPLTRRQYSTAGLVALGSTDHQIARQLGVSPRTVVADLQAIAALVGASGRADLAARLIVNEL